MSKILNRRNAMLGWAVWTIVRHQAKRKAKRTMHLDGEPRRGKGLALVGAALAAVGVFVLWRKLRGGGEAEEWIPPEPAAPAAEPTPLTSVEDDDIPPAA
jgi:hypothetical protein